MAEEEGELETVGLP